MGLVHAQPRLATSGITGGSALLAPKPEYRVFDGIQASDAEGEFVEALRVQESDTRVKDIVALRDVILDTNAVAGGRFRYTRHALRCLSDIAAPGLFKLAMNVGMGDARASSTADMSTAIDIINNVIKLRFSRLVDWQLVIDVGSHTIEGIVSKQYNYFSNLEFYKRCKQFLKDARVNAEFVAASLNGRFATLRMVAPEPLFGVQIVSDVEEVFQRGCYFSNADSGHVAMRTAFMLYRPYNHTCSVADYRNTGKLIHKRGKQFDVTMEKMFDKLAETMHEPPLTYKPQLLELIGAKLIPANDRVDRETRVKTIVRRVRRLGLPTDVASVVVEHALRYGSYGDEASSGSALSRRSAYDVYNTLTHLATTQSSRSREALEAAAFKLLLGKTPIV